MLAGAAAHQGTAAASQVAASSGGVLQAGSGERLLSGTKGVPPLHMDSQKRTWFTKPPPPLRTGPLSASGTLSMFCSSLSMPILARYLVFESARSADSALLIYSSVRQVSDSVDVPQGG